MRDNRGGLPLILISLPVFGALAVFSKESGALLPLYILVVEATLFRFRDGNGKRDQRVVGIFVVSVLAPGCVLLSYLWMHPAAILAGYGGRDFTLTERLLTESRVLVFYLKMIIMPSISELGLYHDDIRLSHGLLDPPGTLYSLITLAGLLLGAVLLRSKRPLVSLGILWFFAGHLLESTVYPLEIAHEHRNYLADYGILLAGTMAVAEAPLRRLAPVIRTAVPLLFFLLFSATTWLRAQQWSDNINNAVYEARHHPNSFRAVFMAGRIYGRLAIQGEPGSADKAYAYLDRASELDHSGIMSTVTRIKLSYILGKPVPSAWFDEILDKLTRHPLTASDMVSLKELASCIGVKCDVPPEMMESIFALALKHENSFVLTIYGSYMINKRGDLSRGLTLFKRAVEVNPREPRLWINLIRLLVVMQRPDEAEEKLMSFEAANTHGGNADDFRGLQESIDALRKSLSSSAQARTPGDG